MIDVYGGQARGPLRVRGKAMQQQHGVQPAAEPKKEWALWKSRQSSLQRLLQIPDLRLSQP